MFTMKKGIIVQSGFIVKNSWNYLSQSDKEDSP